MIHVFIQSTGLNIVAVSEYYFSVKLFHIITDDVTQGCVDGSVTMCNTNEDIGDVIWFCMSMEADGHWNMSEYE